MFLTRAGRPCRCGRSGSDRTSLSECLCKLRSRSWPRLRSSYSKPGRTLREPLQGTSPNSDAAGVSPHAPGARGLCRGSCRGVEVEDVPEKKNPGCRGPVVIGRVGSRGARTAVAPPSSTFAYRAGPACARGAGPVGAGTYQRLADPSSTGLGRHAEHPDRRRIWVSDLAERLQSVYLARHLYRQLQQTARTMT